MGKQRSLNSRTPLVRGGLALAIALAPFAAAQAYVGPGAGLSLLGALWGVLAAIGAAVVFVIMWPIRRMRRRKRDAARAESEQSQANTSDPTDERHSRS